MANDQQDAYADRRAGLEARFAALPPAGTPAYWHAIERTGETDALPLEVLARCFRERAAMGATADTDRIFDLIMRRTGPAVRRWAKTITRKSPSGKQFDLEQDLEQESCLELWEELRSDGPTFLLENFAFALSRIHQHVALDVMQRAGEWQRKGVLRPMRIPRGQTESLDAEPTGTSDLPLATSLADPHAQAVFNLAEYSDLFEMVRNLPDDERTIILGLVCAGRSQAEVASELGVTDRTIRTHKKAIVTKLRRLYLGSEGDDHA